MKKKRTRPFLFGCAAVVVLILACTVIGGALSAVGRSNPTAPATRASVAAAAPTHTLSIAPTTVPTATLPRVVPTAASAAQTTAAPHYASGGLGLTQSEWESTYGKPARDNGTIKSYANDQYIIIYLDGRIMHLERVWGDNAPQSQEFALGAVRPHFPRDARVIESYTAPRSGNPVDRYHSESLAALFPPANFVGGEPGDFVVIYRLNAAGQVTSAVIGIGNNP